MTLRVDNFWVYNGLLVVVIAFFLYRAYHKGFIRQLLDLASLVASYFISAVVCPTLASIVPLYTINTSIQPINDVTNPIINSFLWFVVLLIGLRIVYWILCYVSRKSLKLAPLTWINRTLGLCLGIIKVFLILIVLTSFLKLPIVGNGSLFVESGVLSFIDGITQWLIQHGIGLGGLL